MSPARLSPLLMLLLLAVAPALTACQTDSTGKPVAQAAPAAPAEPPTRQEAAMQCWMSVEKTHKELSLDKRADIVTKCIDDKMNPAAAAAKPAPKAPKAKT
jgi:hypothetical protein